MKGGNRLQSDGYGGLGKQRYSCFEEGFVCVGGGRLAQRSVITTAPLWKTARGLCSAGVPVLTPRRSV